MVTLGVLFTGFFVANAPQNDRFFDIVVKYLPDGKCEIMPWGIVKCSGFAEREMK